MRQGKEKQLRPKTTLFFVKRIRRAVSGGTRTRMYMYINVHVCTCTCTREPSPCFSLVPSLVICWWLVLRVQLDGLLDEVVPLVLQPLPRAHLSRVQPLTIVAVDRLGGRGPGVRVQRATSESRERQEVALFRK